MRKGEKRTVTITPVYDPANSRARIGDQLQRVV